jgi:hypothetical protein
MARKTRRFDRKGKVLDVRSPAGVKLFERLMVNGNLTLVFVKADWCGACHKFNDEVWSNLTKLKRKNMNLASVDSEMIGKTSLANVPRKFYPTLLLVGKDKKPATFVDEEGNPTNAMPRNGSLSEDREAFTNLVQSSLPHKTVSTPEVSATIASTMNKASLQPMSSNEEMISPPLTNLSARGRNSLSRNTLNNVGKSPFDSKTGNVPSIMNEMENNPSATYASPESATAVSQGSVPVASPVASPNESPVASPVASLTKRTVVSLPITANKAPDVGSDLVASQSKAASGPAGVIARANMRGGRLLSAIRNKTASLKAMLKLRAHHTRRNRY